MKRISIDSRNIIIHIAIIILEASKNWIFFPKMKGDGDPREETKKLKDIHTLLNIYFGECWSKMEPITFCKSIIFKALKQVEMVEEDHNNRK